MSLILIVPEDGSIEAQEQQFLRVKKGSNVQLTLNLYKDKFHVYPWDLASPVLLNFTAKKIKSQINYDISKDKLSADWDLSDAATGQLKLVLNSSDLGATIYGDKSTFAGASGDLLKLTVDSIVYDDIDVSAKTTVSQVADAINTAVGRVVATVNGSGYLVIASPTANANACIIIADGTNAGQPCVAKLFETTAKAAYGAWGDLSIPGSYYAEIEFQPNGSSRIYRACDIILDVVADVKDIPVQQSSQTPVGSFREQFVGTGAKTLFPLIYQFKANSCLVFVNGVFQQRGISGDYVEGADRQSIIFNAPLTSGWQGEVIYAID